MQLYHNFLNPNIMSNKDCTNFRLLIVEECSDQNGNQNGLVARPVCFTETVKEVHTAWGWLGLACKMRHCTPVIALFPGSPGT